MSSLDALSVPILLTVGGTEIDLGTLDLPVQVTMGIPISDPHGGAALPLTVAIDMGAFHAGLVSALRETADRIEAHAAATSGRAHG